MMMIVCLLAWAWSAQAAPMSTDRTEDPARTTTTALFKRFLAIRSTQDEESRGSIIAAAVIFSIVVVATIVGFTIMYFRDPQNFLKRRQRKKTGRNLTSSTEPLSEDYLKRSSSLVSDRESIMFSRSRSSSLQFAVVELEKPPPLPKVMYAPLEQIDTYNARYTVMNDSHHHHHNSNISETSTSTIPVVVTPPPETPTSQPQPQPQPQTTAARPADLKASAPNLNPPTEKQQATTTTTTTTTTTNSSSTNIITTSTSHVDDESSALLPRS